MARRVSQREPSQEAHPDDAPLNEHLKLKEYQCSHVPELLGKVHGRKDNVQVNTTSQFVVLLVSPLKTVLVFGKRFSIRSF